MELLLRAKATAQRLEDSAEALELRTQARRQLVAQLLSEAIEKAQGGEEQRLEELQRAVEGAERMGIQPELRASRLMK